MKRIILIIICALYVSTAMGQKATLYFDHPMVVDSSSSIIIPTVYNTELLSANKIAIGGNFYANIIFYNFTNDSSKKLFDKDTYILSFNNRYYYSYPNPRQTDIKNVTAQRLFYQVKNVDHNKNGRIDNNDPAILYTSDIHGNNLTALTASNENVISFEVFEKQHFALLQIQRDMDKDLDFEYSDKDYYYIKLDLNTLMLGNKIEIQ